MNTASPLLSDLADQYATFNRVIGKLSINTQTDYRRRVRTWLRTLPEGATPETVTRQAVQFFCIDLASHQPGVVRPVVSACRHFSKWLIKQRYLRDDPFADVELPPCSNNVRNPVPDYISRRMLDACDHLPVSPLRRARAKALISILTYGALRRSEVLGLSIADIHWDEKRVHIRHGKGNKERSVYVCRECMAALFAYHALRPIATKHDQFFSHDVARPMAAPGLYAVLRAVAAAAGITEKVTPHMFRHASATRDADRGVPLTVIQSKLGHSKLISTARYLHTDERLQKEYAERNTLEAAPPVNRPAYPHENGTREHPQRAISQIPPSPRRRIALRRRAA